MIDPGGHTGEAIQLLSALETDRYTPRTYIFCTGDSMSVTKAAAFESGLASKPLQNDPKTIPSSTLYRLVELPRARNVGQSYLSSVGTTLYSMLITLWKLAVEPVIKGRTKQIPDLLIVNGPGTCVVVVLVYRLLRVSSMGSE
jgi:beta-1,4-N-acetylglucosaminyltransferase